MSRNPRINVTLNSSDYEVMGILCEKKKLSMSSLAKRMIEEWLEEYEDMLLAKRAEEAEEEWIKEGCPTISHEELCQKLGIQSNIPNEPKKTSKNSLRISNKGSLGRSKKGYVSRQGKLASL